MAMLRVRNMRSRKDTKAMILAMAKYTNNYIERHDGDHLVADADVEQYLSEYEVDLLDLVEECRSKDETVPFFENLIGGGGHQANAAGGTVSYVDESGEETVVFRDGESGYLTFPGYLGLFEQAVEDFDRCVERGRYGDFLSCASNGVASIEAYLNHKARTYNKRNPEKKLIDNKQYKVSFDDKIDKWVPTMTGGQRLRKGNQRWEHFKRLRAIRDKHQAHSNLAVMSVDYRALAKLLNLFRTGIAGLLLDLHILFGDRHMAPVIVRSAYLPDVEHPDLEHATATLRMGAEARRQRLSSYFAYYYDELQRGLPACTDDPESVPHILRPYDRIVQFVECRDGYVVLHRADPENEHNTKTATSFELEWSYQDQTVSAFVGRDLPTDAPFWVTEAFFLRNEETGEYAAPLDWERRDLIGNRRIEQWASDRPVAQTGEEGIDQAKEDLRTFFDRQDENSTT